MEPSKEMLYLEYAVLKAILEDSDESKDTDFEVRFNDLNIQEQGRYLTEFIKQLHEVDEKSILDLRFIVFKRFLREDDFLYISECRKNVRKQWPYDYHQLIFLEDAVSALEISDLVKQEYQYLKDIDLNVLLPAGIRTTNRAVSIDCGYIIYNFDKESALDDALITMTSGIIKHQEPKNITVLKTVLGNKFRDFSEDPWPYIRTVEEKYNLIPLN